jgi:hypothetical protein
MPLFRAEFPASPTASHSRDLTYGPSNLPGLENRDFSKPAFLREIMAFMASMLSMFLALWG